MIACFIAFVVGMNIVSSFYLIKKAKETITKYDYVKLTLESLFITLMMLLAYVTYLFFKGNLGI